MASCTEFALTACNHLKLHPGLDPLAVTPCCCDIAFSREQLPILQQLPNLGPHQAAGVKKNRLSLANTYKQCGQPWGRCTVQGGRRLGPGPEGLGALQSRRYLPGLSPSWGVCPAPTNRLTTELPVPKGNLVGLAINSFLYNPLSWSRGPPTARTTGRVVVWE